MVTELSDVLINMGSAIGLGIYAWNNRHGSLREYVQQTAPLVAKAYVKASPAMEHFVWGYSLTAFGHGTDQLTTLLIDHEIQNPNLLTYLWAGIAGVGDLLWEGNQAIERRKIYPGQFLGTCAGIVTNFGVNYFLK